MQDAASDGKMAKQVRMTTLVGLFLIPTDFSELTLSEILELIDFK